MFFPKFKFLQILSSESKPEDQYVRFFEEFVQKTARLVAQWQSVGFCHGYELELLCLLGLNFFAKGFDGI